MTAPFVVAVHRWWPGRTHTTAPITHIGPFPDEAAARAFCDSLEQPMIGYAYNLIPTDRATSSTWRYTA
jgi:hypothetical protein